MANKPICFVEEYSAAGLMAGTVPTMGIEKCWRNEGNTMVLAVLQAITMRSKAYKRSRCVQIFIHTLNNECFRFFRIGEKCIIKTIEIMTIRESFLDFLVNA